MSENKKLVLVVDDNEDLCSLLIDSLSSDELEVIGAHDGEEGLALALEKHPGVILLDIMMPKMDGWEMLEKLRTDEWGKDAEVIMLTNAGDMESISKAVDNSTFEYLIKSDLDVEDIAKKVQEKLSM